MLKVKVRKFQGLTFRGEKLVGGGVFLHPHPLAILNRVNTSAFVLKTKYDANKLEIENKISDTSGFVKKTDYNTKITEIEAKIPDVTNLARKNCISYC